MKTLCKQTGKLLILGLFFVVFACSPEELPTDGENVAIDNQNAFLVAGYAEKVNIFKGPEVQLEQSKACSWISVNRNRFPVEIVVELTSKALNDLSLLDTEHELATVLPLHKKAIDLTPFEHIVLDYQAEGHGPTLWSEHFDFHFYTITNEERMAIPSYDENNQRIVDAYNFFPDMTKKPSDYFKFPGELGVYPMIGKHWLPLDFQTGDFPFTTFVVLGSYWQKNNFIAPMVTAEYLMSGEEFSGNYSQPETSKSLVIDIPLNTTFFTTLMKGKFISL